MDCVVSETLRASRNVGLFVNLYCAHFVLSGFLPGLEFHSANTVTTESLELELLFAHVE